MIKADSLVKEFKVTKKKEGIKNAVKSVFIKKTEIVKAVDGISFSIDKGEIVGYIGPNGSGKSTTIKMMSGIMKPTSGKVLIDGLDPMKDRKNVVQNLGVVFGQRTQLYWDLRLGETFELLKRIYKVPDDVYKKNIELMNDLLEIHKLTDTPVRQLSLGQRMRGDLAAAMLHSPSVMFLDEPTIGLDIDAKYAVRKFIKDVNREKQTTVILTTHDLDDIQELCNRVIIINEGKVVIDGELEKIISESAPVRRLVIDFYDIPDEISHPKAKIIKKEGLRIVFEFKKDEVTVPEIISHISKTHKIRDISIEETDIEDIIQKIYQNRGV